jgi:hypothetical protein
LWFFREYFRDDGRRTNRHNPGGGEDFTEGSKYATGPMSD